MQTLNQDIKEKSFKKIYLLYGDEPFLVGSYKKKLREAITGGDTMNFNYFEGKNPDVKEIISLADTMPFFADRRLILVDGSGFFKSAQEELAAYLPQMPDTTCLVFAESEVISQLAMGTDKCDIIHGIHKSVAGRVSGLCHRIGVRDDVVMTGGVAQNHGIVKALQEQLGHEIHTTPLTQYNGALGAALFAYQKALKNK